MLILSISVFLGLLSVLNKILLYMERPFGWISGMMIGLLSSYYFYSIDLFILSIAEIAFFIVMLFGLLHRSDSADLGRFSVNIMLSILSVSVFLLFYTGIVTIFELVSSLAFCWGGYILTTNYRAVGWLLLIVAHTATSAAGFKTNQYIFAYLQIASALVCVFAAYMQTQRPSAQANR